MRHIEQKTIDKHVRFLKIVLDAVGKELDLQKVVQALHLQNSTHYYAKKLGFIDFKGNKILKAHYDKPDPIIARRLIEGMNRIKIENAKIKIDRELELKQKAEQELKQKPQQKPKQKLQSKEMDDIIESISKEGPILTDPEPRTYNHKVQLTKRKKTIHIFGIPVIRVVEE